MEQAVAKDLIARMENFLLQMKDGRSEQSVVLIEQIEVTLSALKAEIEKELPTVQSEPTA
jgi:hemerythrin-like domain-containing protein